MAWASLKRGILNQHVLMEFGAFGGLAGGLVSFFSQPWPPADFLGAAVFITAYPVLSAYVSLLVGTRRSQVIRKLMALQPATAPVVHGGREEDVPVERVRAGNRVRIRPGENIPVDGEMIEGASAVERLSEHPLARAIVEHAEVIDGERYEADGFEALPGRGVRAQVGGRAVWVGSPRLLPTERADVPSVQNAAGRLESQGATVVAVTHDDRVTGLIAITDTLKPDAREAVARMKAAGLEPVMISGDNQRTARAVAAKVGIDEVMAEVLPEDKAAEVRRLQRAGHRVAMVGDGINDAPALTQADVGIAIGAGTDIAIEAADVVLIGERLGGVVDAYEIGKSSFRKTVQNVTLAFAFNGIGVPAAVTGLVHPVMAMVAMAASVTAVLANSFAGRLLPRRGSKRQQETTMTTLQLTVPTMHCAGCLATIREKLGELPGVRTVEGDLDRKRVTVQTEDPALGREQLCAALIAIGHDCGDA